MKKKIIFCYIYFIILGVVLTACGNNNDILEKSTNVPGKTCFSKYSESLCVGENVLNLVFFATEEDAGRWDINNIKEIYLEIGDITVEGKILSLEISKNLLYDKYYYGGISFSVNLKEATGEAYLRVLFNSDTEIQKYNLGLYSVKLNTVEDTSNIAQLVCGGVVKTDEHSNVFTYGIIIHCEILQNITIKKIDVGLENIGLNTKDYRIYSSEQYKNEIYDAIDNTVLDEIVESAYEKKIVNKIDSTIDLKLQEGEYYLYFPIVCLDEEVPALCQSIICIEYTNAAGEQVEYVSNSYPFFSEYSKSEVEIEKMFKE